MFEVPTTLDALHDLIAAHASTGADASLIVRRVHATNSVRLDRRNRERMQNFYDVLLRRFVAVGDAVFGGGDGGPGLGRYAQLDALTATLFAMSRDSPECAGAVWSRRLGIFQKGARGPAALGLLCLLYARCSQITHVPCRLTKLSVFQESRSHTLGGCLCGRIYCMALYRNSAAPSGVAPHLSSHR